MIDELIGQSPNNTVKAICDMFSRRYFDHTAGLFVYGDATAQKEDTTLEQGHIFFTLIISYLDKFKPRLRVLKSNPSVAMRGSFIIPVVRSSRPPCTIFELIYSGPKAIGKDCCLTINALSCLFLHQYLNNNSKYET
jgi:hypothetical protein